MKMPMLCSNPKDNHLGNQGINLTAYELFNEQQVQRQTKLINRYLWHF
jgi:hypothetical protein